MTRRRQFLKPAGLAALHSMFQGRYAGPATRGEHILVVGVGMSWPRGSSGAPGAGPYRHRARRTRADWRTGLDEW